MQEQRLRPSHFPTSVCGQGSAPLLPLLHVCCALAGCIKISSYNLVKAAFVSSQVDSSVAVLSLLALVCHRDHHSFTEGTNSLLPGLTSTTQGASSSSNKVPIITSIVPEATQGPNADAGISGGSVSERQSSGGSTQPAASFSGAMPADITGACSKGFPYLQRLALLLSCLPCLLQSTKQLRITCNVV